VHFDTLLHFANQFSGHGDEVFISGIGAPTMGMSQVWTPSRSPWHPFCSSQTLIADVLLHSFRPSRTGELSDAHIA
jgi:hypothetical protein